MAYNNGVYKTLAFKTKSVLLKSLENVRVIWGSQIKTKYKEIKKSQLKKYLKIEILLQAILI